MNEEEMAKLINEEHAKFVKYCSSKAECSPETCYISEFSEKHNVNTRITCFSVYLMLTALKEI